MSTIRLDIVTPERKVFSDDVEMVVTRAAEGDIGILPRHAPFVSPLGITAVRIKKDGERNAPPSAADLWKFVPIR